MLILFKSRYGQPRQIDFNESEKTVRFLSTHSYCRYSINSDNQIVMIDPEGGPFIYVGMSLADLDEGLPNLKIKSIETVKSGEMEHGVGESSCEYIFTLE